MNQKIFYVYRFDDPKYKLPVYIGKGNGSRAWVHLYQSSNPHLTSMLVKRGREGYQVEPRIILYGEERYCLDMEVKLIGFYGRADLRKGTLFNHTNGGDGGAGRIRSDEEKLKHSFNNKLRVESGEHNFLNVLPWDSCNATETTIGIWALAGVAWNIWNKYRPGSSNLSQIFNYDWEATRGPWKTMVRKFKEEPAWIPWADEDWLDFYANYIQHNSKPEAIISQNPEQIIQHQFHNVQPWEHFNSTAKTKRAWVLADKAWHKWKDLDYGSRRLARVFGVLENEGSFDTMLVKFRDGWVPKNDSSWIQFFNKHKGHYGDLIKRNYNTQLPRYVQSERNPWENNTQNEQSIKLWVVADVAFQLWNEYGYGYRKMAKALGFKCNPGSMIQKFKNGWDPSEDISWTLFRAKYDKEFGMPKILIKQQTLVERHIQPWKNSKTSNSLHVWVMADKIWKVWDSSRCGSKKLANHFDEMHSKTWETLVKRYRLGWIPEEDVEWVCFSKQRIQEDER
mgnify:CR=1 FL=1